MSQKCRECRSEMKDLKDLFQVFEEHGEQIFWCPFCGVLEDPNQVDAFSYKPLIYTPREARDSLLNG